MSLFELTSRTKRLLLALVLTIYGTACGDDTTDTEGDDSLAGVVPEDEILSLLLEDTTTGFPLIVAIDTATVEQAQMNEESRYRAWGVQAMTDVNAWRARFSARIQLAFGDADPDEVTEDTFTCQRWAADGQTNTWRLLACQSGDDRTWRLEGGSIGSSTFTIVAGGATVLLADGGKAGVASFDGDAFGLLTGEPGTGKASIGFRRAGGVRQLTLALVDVVAANSTVHTGVYRWRAQLGQGGSFSFVTPRDFFTQDAMMNFALGQDGTNEVLVSSIAWRYQMGARNLVVGCGGTLGVGQCRHVIACWGATGMGMQESLEPNANSPSWDAMACPEGVAPRDPDSSDTSPPELGLSGRFYGDSPVSAPGADPNESY